MADLTNCFNPRLFSNTSMITEYNDEPFLSPSKSRDEIYASRLEARIKDLKRAIKSNKPIVEQLKAQRKFFKKICEKQRQKIEGTSVDQLRQDYEREIETIQDDRFRLQDMIGLVHEESNSKVSEYVDAKRQLKESEIFLRKSLEETELENLQYEKLIILKNHNIDQLQSDIEMINIEISKKECVERKFLEAMRTIEQLEGRR